MPAPTLTPEEIVQLQAEVVRQGNFATALAAAIPAQAARAAELAVTDGAFKKFFDYYNDDIIGNYDDEREAIGGDYIAAPITEADVEGPANIDGSVRTTPTMPVTDITRVDEFDGTPIINTTTNEQVAITGQIPYEGYLTLTPPSPTVNATTKTTTALTSGSTTLGITDAATPITFSIGDYFVVTNLTTSAFVKVTSATPGGGGPPYTYTLGIQVIVPPAATIASTSDVQVFTPFTNTERTNKVAAAAYLQNIMDNWIAGIQAQVTLRIARLTTQIAALTGQSDPDATSQTSTALSNAQTSSSYLTTYLVTTLITDAALTVLAAERVARSAFLTTRLAQIAANYTGQSENYYDRRYSVANDRGNTSRGTLRLQKATEASSTTLTTYAASAQDAVDALNALLP